jgi:hypothetical protein
MNFKQVGQQQNIEQIHTSASFQTGGGWKKI